MGPEQVVDPTPAFTALGEAIAVAVVFSLALVAAILFTAIAGVLQAIRRSLKAAGVGGVASIVVFASVIAVSGEPASAILAGAVAFATGFIVARQRWPTDNAPVILQHNIISLVVLIVAGAGVAAIALAWAVLVGAIGFDVVALLWQHPFDAAIILGITLVTGGVGFVAWRDVNRSVR